MTEQPQGEDTNERELRRATEALLLVTEEPITPELLAQLLEVAADRVEATCRELGAEYDATDRGFQLVKVAGGWRFQTHPDLAPYIERFVLDGQSGRLSGAALETLAIVAYKQPISRAQIAAIRGVNVDGVMRTLSQRGYVDEVGRDHGPGQAVLYGTTPTFLEKLGLNSLDELPALGEFVPSADVYEALEKGLRPDALDAEADPVTAADEDGDEGDDGEPGPAGSDDDPPVGG
ncbi:MAG: SMC-Scp complex subunit ScpB [Acidimicrobiia bacterium]